MSSLVSGRKALPIAALPDGASKCCWGGTEIHASAAVNRWLCFCPGRPAICSRRPF